MLPKQNLLRLSCLSYDSEDVKMNTVHKPLGTFAVWVALLWCVVTPKAAADQTFAERLGWKADDTVLVIELAEGGMSHAVNRGITQVLDKGMEASVSAMMTGPWVPALVRYVQNRTSTDIGVELTFTSEFEGYRWGPLSGKPKVPSLVDEQGCLWKSIALLAAKGTADDVEAEIRAQIERAEGLGLKVSHLTSHMQALFSKPEFFDRYVKVAVEKQIPLLLPAGHATHANLENTNLVQMVKKQAAQIWNSGLPLVDDVHTASADWEVVRKAQRFTDTFHVLKPGITVLVMNPAVPTDEFNFITSKGRTRLADAMAVQDPEFKKVIQNRGIILTDWRELKERRAKAAKM